MQDPRVPHLEAAYRILHYLKAAPGNAILFSKYNHLRLEAYTEVDWAGSPDDRCLQHAIVHLFYFFDR